MYGELTLSAVAVGSTATIEIRTTTNRMWTVSQVSIEMDTVVAGGTCELRKNGTFITELIPNGDVAGGDPPIQIRPGDVMTVKWSGVSAGQVGKAFVIYDDGETVP